MNQTLTPHRGTLILVLGILSLAVCPFFGIASWVMGRGDLALMDAGRMDPEGRGLTEGGRICGMVSVVLSVIGVLVSATFLLLVGVIAALQG